MKKLLLLLLSICTLGVVQSQNLPEPMYPHSLVNDFVDIFTNEEKASLEQILRNYNDSTSTQIYVVSVSDLDGYAASDYAIKLGEKWGVGQKGKDNGAVILIKPKQGNSRGDVFIAVGYGLEEKLNDARIGRILDTDMIPSLRDNDYYTGVRKTIFAMIDYLSGQYKNDPQIGTIIISIISAIGKILLFIFISFVFIFIFGAIISSFGGSSNSSSFNSDDSSSDSSNSNSSSSSNSDSSSGSSFKGGGGGRFGGGGAGRKW